MDEKGTLGPARQDVTVDWVGDRSECSVNQRTWGGLDGLNTALKIKIVENTEEQTPKFSHKNLDFLLLPASHNTHETASPLSRLELRAAVLMETETGFPPSCPHQPASPCYVALRHLWAFRFSGLPT